MDEEHDREELTESAGGQLFGAHGRRNVNVHHQTILCVLSVDREGRDILSEFCLIGVSAAKCRGFFNDFLI